LVSHGALVLKLPAFAEKGLAGMVSKLSPMKLDVRDLLNQQQKYHGKAVSIEGRVKTVVSIDETGEETVSTWRLSIIPDTVTITASATFFYLEDAYGENVLVKYLADLDVCANDEVAIIGLFNGYAVTVEKQGLWRTKNQQVINELGEPFIAAMSVENRTKQKVEYIRENKEQ
jgi:hypothetical protein